MNESAETDTRPSAAKFAPGAVGVTARPIPTAAAFPRPR